MVVLNAREAKAHFSRLLARVQAGEEIVIARNGQPIARLTPLELRSRRILGQDQGLFEVPDDFDDPLPPGWA